LHLLRESNLAVTKHNTNANIKEPVVNEETEDKQEPVGFTLKRLIHQT
jgi:hypothetical protein